MSGRSLGAGGLLLRLGALVGLTLVALAATGVVGVGGQPPATTVKHRGVSWEAQPRAVGEGELAALARQHVDWIVQTPFGWQSATDEPRVRLRTDGGVFWGETDEGLTVTARLAKRHGIKTLLKPHVWIRGGQWRGDLAMKSSEDWDAWFSSYEEFILHYARLAERLDLEGLAVGTELHQTVRQRPADWRRIIAKVRRVYGGELTYSANWYREFEDVVFWDDLDYIGIQAYFPLTDRERPTVAELRRGWARHLPAIEAVHEKHGRPVLFTELGYRSTADAAIEPWVWPQRGEDATVDLATQANAYQAFFEAVWHQPWFAGAYIWKWHPWSEWPALEDHTGFTPQGKPALAVMSRWYRESSGPRRSSAD